MHKVIVLISLFLLSLASQAQDRRFVRYNCMPDIDVDASPSDARSLPAHRRLPQPKTDYDPTVSYPQLVILMEFKDRQFTIEEPQTFYDRMLNEPGFNQGRGPGCVADYFRTQSSGRFNLQFDVVGPVRINYTYKGNDYGNDLFRKALLQAIDSLDIDLSRYDWDGNGVVEQVAYIYAGYGGNETAAVAEGSIWPNTSSFGSVTKDGVKASNYTASPELFSTNKSCGIGTFCHEFSHSLGLPDIYPTSSTAVEFSIVDEWDLMDGGNFINGGWCPPSYTALEKMLLGWLTPVKLTEPTVISNLKPTVDGGEVYQVINPGYNNEFFLIENRQWKGWDLRLPGHGLLITHVDYRQTSWTSNTVNNDSKQHRFDIVCADNRTYDQWKAIIGDNNPYVSGHSRILSTAPYPYVDADQNICNDSLTNLSTPAATLFHKNTDGTKMLGMPITAIVENADSTVSFRFGEDTSTAIRDVNTPANRQRQAYYIIKLGINRNIVINKLTGKKYYESHH